ncbi:30S ribosomal protein S15 [[Eubacterium] cellulosolvens]
MAKLFTRRHGRSGSTRPVSKKLPSWCKYREEEVEPIIVSLSKQGNSQSSIGSTLRDKYGIPLTRSITGQKIGKMLSKAKLSPDIPEDLRVLLDKAEGLAKHLQRHKQDYVNKHSLALVESKVHRLGNYYKSRGVLPADWKYKPVSASVE